MRGNQVQHLVTLEKLAPKSDDRCIGDAIVLSSARSASRTFAKEVSK